MTTTVSDFATTLNTLKSKYRRELFLAIGLIVIFPLLGWHGFIADDIELVVLSVIIVSGSIANFVLGYKKYYGIKPDFTAEEDPTIQMKSQVNFLKSILKIEKIYSFISGCSLCIYFLFIFFYEPYNIFIISIMAAIMFIGIVVFSSRAQLNQIRKSEETIETLENNILQIKSNN